MGPSINSPQEMLMSKPHETSNLISFKISVPAEDLEKALDLTVWPLQVSVREFIRRFLQILQMSSFNNNSRKSAENLCE